MRARPAEKGKWLSGSRPHFSASFFLPPPPLTPFVRDGAGKRDGAAVVGAIELGVGGVAVAGGIFTFVIRRMSHKFTRIGLVSLKMRFEAGLVSQNLSKSGVGVDMVISNLTGSRGVNPRHHVDITRIRAQSYNMGAQPPRCNPLRSRS